MRTSQTLTLELSEERSTLAEVTAKLNKAAEAGDEPAAEDMAAADASTRKIRALEVRYRAAVIAEEEEDRKAADGDPNAEPARLAQLEARCSVTSFLNEAVTGAEVDGAPAEFRAETLGDAAAPGFMPLRLLAVPEDREEKRAVTPVADAAIGLGSQAEILPRIFTRSIAAGLGVSMPSVPMGTRTWPVMATGTTASMQAPSGEQPAGAGSFRGETLGPRRLTGSYEFRVEDLVLLRGLEESLRRDLRAVIADQMDDQVVNGDGNAPNVDGFLSGAANTGIADPEAAGAEVFNYDQFVAAFVAGVDGFHSYSVTDIRAVIAELAYAHAETLYRANNTDDTVYAVMARRSGGVRVSNRMPRGQGITDAIFSRSAFPGTTAVAPIWEAVQMIRDPYSLAQQGEVRVTMLMLWNFKVIRGAAFYRRKLRHAV